MANISVTYTFSNGTTADATEVNTNFTDIINGTSDGTKDFSINALTCAGTATLNGAVNLGNATTDDITFNGLVASNIIPKTAAASDLGSSSLPWQSIYLDNGATDGGAIYFDAGTTEFIKANAAGTDLDIGGFARLDMAAGYFQETTSAKSDSYTVTDTDGIKVILMTTGGSDRTVTLPTAADNTGRIIKVVKVDSGTGKCTVDGEGSEKCGGNTTGMVLPLQFDFVEVVCDGTEWHVISYNQISAWADWSPTMKSSGGADPVFGTNTEISKYRRNGNCLEVFYNKQQTTAGSVSGAGYYYWPFPLSLTADTSLLENNGQRSENVCGSAATTTNTTYYLGVCRVTQPNDAFIVTLNNETQATIEAGSGGGRLNDVTNNIVRFSFHGLAPVTEWANCIPKT